MEVQNSFLEDLKVLGVGRRAYDDEFFKDNKIFPQLEKRLGFTDLDEEDLCHAVVNIVCHIPGCVAKFESLMKYESHYNTVHRYLCSECKKNLPSAHLLDLHFAESHDSFFAVLSERGPAFCCYIQQCSVKFLNPAERRKHCIEEHKFPSDFRFDALRQHKKKDKPQKSRKNKNPKKFTGDNSTDMMVVEENSNHSSSTSPGVARLKNFSFGHSKNRGFSKGSYTGRVFTNDDKNSNVHEKSALDSEDLFVHLKETLPEC